MAKDDTSEAAPRGAKIAAAAAVATFFALILTVIVYALVAGQTALAAARSPSVVPSTFFAVRTMFAVYVCLILAGIAFYAVVGIRHLQMSRFLSLNSLSLFFLAIFLASVTAESVVGLHAHNEEAAQHGSEELSWSRFVYSSEFGSAVLENWQSEWLQFCLFVIATVWLLQQGSPESKELDKAGLESDEEQKIGEHAEASSPRWARVGGLRTRIYENSLLIAFAVVFFGSWFAQAVTNWSEYNGIQQDHDDPRVSFGTYLTRPDFWERTLQNWQSEFLAVGTMVVLAIYLRQRGSPESKRVGAPHDATGQTG